MAITKVKTNNMKLSLLHCNYEGVVLKVLYLLLDIRDILEQTEPN